MKYISGMTKSFPQRMIRSQKFERSAPAGRAKSDSLSANFCGVASSSAYRHAVIFMSSFHSTMLRHFSRGTRRTKRFLFLEIISHGEVSWQLVVACQWSMSSFYPTSLLLLSLRTNLKTTNKRCVGDSLHCTAATTEFSIHFTQVCGARREFHLRFSDR